MRLIRKLLLPALLFAALTTCAAAANRVNVTQNEYYDSDERCFVIIVPEMGNREIYTNVANGMVTADRVSIVLDDFSDVELYRDGNLLDDPDLSRISEPGGYTLSLNGVGMDYQPLSFQIVSEVTGAISEYLLPTGFSVSGVEFNGEPQAVSSGRVDLAQEGEYCIDYVCVASGTLFRLEVEMDHTPPELELAAVNEIGIAKGPVSVADVESGAAMVVTHNGKKATVGMDGMLKETGDYHIVLTDAAGNTTEYVFRIAVYFSFVTILAFLFLAAVIVALCLYLTRERKKMRVR